MYARVPHSYAPPFTWPITHSDSRMCDMIFEFLWLYHYTHAMQMFKNISQNAMEWQKRPISPILSLRHSTKRAYTRTHTARQHPYRVLHTDSRTKPKCRVLLGRTSSLSFILARCSTVRRNLFWLMFHYYYHSAFEPRARTAPHHSASVPMANDNMTKRTNKNKTKKKIRLCRGNAYTSHKVTK